MGRSRLEAISVLATACIMTMASAEVIQYSVIDLLNGFNGTLPQLNVNYLMYVLMWTGIGMKLLLYCYCYWVQRQSKSDTLGALVEDHLNDVMSNVAAVVTAVIASNRRYWYIDPIGAIVISIVIIYRWFTIINEQVKKIVGYTAPKEFLDEVSYYISIHLLVVSMLCVCVCLLS